MSVEVATGTPLAEALHNAVQPKLAEVGWSTGAADDSALAEYIILMLVNGKTQSQIASELSNDLLGLGPDDPSTNEFATWLFDQVHTLNAQLNGGQDAHMDSTQSAITPAVNQDNSSQDQTMGDGGDSLPEGAIPTGPKSMRNGKQQTRDRRMLGHMNKALDRTNDATLHRIRGGGGVGRINTHNNREPPKGPRNMANRMQNMSQMNSPMTQNAIMGANPQQQMQLFKMLEEQSRMMAQILGPGQQFPNAPAINPAFFNGQQGQQGQQGKSLFERIEKPRKNSNFKNNQRPNAGADAMETDGAENADSEQKEPSTIPCRFQLSCTNPSCHFGHQSPAAPPGIALDLTDKCPYGAACTNKKCVASHPSPAQKRAHLSTQVDCKFYPNCTNPNCPFKHPSTPPCRNGADCPERDSGCQFSHSDIMCRYTPCLNPNCPYRHNEGQKRSANWTNPNAKHVSDRTFVTDADGEEELIIPGQGNGDQQQQGQSAEQQQQQGQAQQANADVIA
ncbi:nuclear polyadenylated RNA-binding protein Nab2, partial [Aureobasidium melanogenum]